MGNLSARETMSCSFVEVRISSLLHNYSNTLLCGDATRIVVECATWGFGVARSAALFM